MNMYRHGIRLLYITLMVILAYSVVTSGLRYQYDADELMQVQLGYLMATGAIPYQDFHFIYTPIFPTLLGFVLSHMGFTFTTVEFLRLCMVVLFGIRILLTVGIIAELFGSLAAWIFPILLLLDPFTTFAGMQIRYDNLMLTVYTLGIFVYIAAVKRKNLFLLIFSGAFLALSFFIIVKIFPSLVVFLILLSLWCIARHKARELFAIALGGLIVCVLYSVPFVLQGTFFRMMQQAFIEPRALLASAIYQTYVGFFYQPDNIFIYGLPGRPLPWVYAWMLPILGFIGAYSVIISRFNRSKQCGMIDVVAVSLAGALIAHWILLFTLSLVMIQYYLPISTYFALFGAVSIAELWRALQRRRLFHRIFSFALAVSAVFFVGTSFQANMARAKIDTHWTVERYQKLWSIVPPDRAVFPEVLFRPIAYPLFNGYFTCCTKGGALLEKYRPIYTYLSVNNVQFLVLSDYVLGFLPVETRLYIFNNYTKNSAYPDLYVRNR